MRTTKVDTQSITGLVRADLQRRGASVYSLASQLESSGPDAGYRWVRGMTNPRLTTVEEGLHVLDMVVVPRRILTAAQAREVAKLDREAAKIDAEYDAGYEE